MAADPVKVHFNGTAGQSFGVWNAGGLEMILTGDANDYVGKGMTGGKLVIKPHVGVAFKSTRRPSSATPASTALPAANSMLRVPPASASRCATQGPSR